MVEDLFNIARDSTKIIILTFSSCCDSQCHSRKGFLACFMSIYSSHRQHFITLSALQKSLLTHNYKIYPDVAEGQTYTQTDIASQLLSVNSLKITFSFSIS